MKTYYQRACAGAVTAAALVLLAACGSGSDASGSAKPAELVVTSFGGDYESAQQKAVFAKFEQEHNVKIKLVTIYSADALAKLSAAPGKSGIDVVQFSGGQEVAAAEKGLIEKIKPGELTNAAAVYPQAEQEGYAPAYALDVSGFIYREGISPIPTSWNSLKDPAYKGKLAIPDISTSYGVQTLFGLAKASGGSSKDVKPGFTALKDVVSANDPVIAKDAASMVQLFSRGEVDFGVYDGIYAFLMQKQGIKVGFAVPSEGSSLTKVTMNVVSGTKQHDLAVKLIDMALDAEVQSAFAEQTGAMPSNKNAKVTGSAATVMPKPDQLSQIEPVDGKYVSDHRAEWTAQWNRTIAR